MTRNMDVNMLCLFKVVDNTTSSIRSITGNPNKLFINNTIA